MFIILSIHSKNTNSLTNFLKFFYKLEKKRILKLRLYTKQYQKKKKNSFFSVLRSPHVNKKSQEQFEYNVYNKKLKVQVYQLNKFLCIWKWIKTKLFFDITITTCFLLKHSATAKFTYEKTDYERFVVPMLKTPSIGVFRVNTQNILKTYKTTTIYLPNETKQTLLKLIDIQGEKLLTKRFLKV